MYHDEAAFMARKWGGMKQTMDTFYCMKCDSLVPIDSAAVVFRTGFYRGGIPLGKCAACAVKLAEMQRLECGQPRPLPMLA
jgi:hypothetical protein